MNYAAKKFYGLDSGHEKVQDDDCDFRYFNFLSVVRTNAACPNVVACNVNFSANAIGTYVICANVIRLVDAVSMPFSEMTCFIDINANVIWLYDIGINVTETNAIRASVIASNFY